MPCSEASCETDFSSLRISSTIRAFSSSVNFLLMVVMQLTYSFFSVLFLCSIIDLGTDYEIVFSKILKLKAFDEIIVSLKNVSLEIADRILNRERPKTWIEQIIEFVNLNYKNTDISLKTLSVHFNMTAPYLGQL